MHNKCELFVDFVDKRSFLIKLKVFTSKRIVSGVLSAAMAFNMATYFPVSAFAHEEISTESTVDLNEIKVNGQLMSNGYLSMYVLSDGHFSIGTTGGDADNSKDDNKRMLYGFPGSSTSYTTLRVDNSSYVYSPSQNEFSSEDGNNISNAIYADVNTQQILSIVNNPATGNDDLIEVKYVVTNESNTEKSVGLRIMMDTMLGDNDSAPFRVPQYGSITTETEYVGDEIPQFWQAFDNLTSPSVIAQGRLYQTEEDRPDKVQFCNWGNVNSTNWNYTTTSGRGNGDSAVTMTWNETALAPNETREYVTYYGLSEFTEDMSLPLGLSVYSDSELSAVNNQYAPNPVDVTAYIQNLSSNTAENVQVRIELPDNLTLTNNSEQTIDIGTMTPNQLEQTSWSVYISPISQETTYQYTVVLTAADGYEKRVSRSIHVPALQVEEVSPYVLFSGSNNTDFILNCWKSTFYGDVYAGRDFISNSSELYLNGNVNAVDSIYAYGWKVNIQERNEQIEREEMPDWDSRIIAMAGDYEISNQDVVEIEDRNVIDGAVRTSGNVVVSGTTFDGNCYIIADGDITYNVNDFVSSGRVVLYSRNGNITINGTNIDVNGILYAPNGTVAFNSNVANVNGRIFADRINFSGSIFNVTGSDSDWELLGRKAVITKTYTFDEDFNEGIYDGLGIDIADELTLEQRTDSVTTSVGSEYKDEEAVNGIAFNVKTDKSVLSKPEDTVNVEIDLNGFGTQEVEENSVDLAIVVDTSGSMSNARRNNAVIAAKEVVSKMKDNDRCAIIKFTTGATVLQEFTDDAELLNAAIDKLNANGGTDIATGINKAIELFNGLEGNSRQKYIILMSDGEDSSASAQAALNAYAQGITICALSIGSDSRQMETIANNTNGYYKNSPTAEQIGEMMNMFADVVFNNAGTDVTFSTTLEKNATVDAESMSPAPTEIVENENATKTLKWTYDKLTIDQSEKISFPLTISEIDSGLRSIMSDVSCTYYNRAGVSKTVYADDIILPAHTYKQTGSWTTVYDSKTSGTEWKNIYWNGRLYDDGVISVMAQAGDDTDALGEWVEIVNHKDISDLKGRYIRVKVNMKVSSSGKTPELFDITLLSDGADQVNYVNNAPAVTVTGNNTTCVSKKITLVSNAEDDSFNSQLAFNWSCDNENVQIFNADKPYASFKFNEAGNYEITLSVSDDSSTSIITKTITVLNDDVLVKPMIDIEVPSIVKSGETISCRVINLNDAEISDYEVMVGGSVVTVAADGQFDFTAPDSDTIIAVEAKAFNILGVSGTASKAITVDGIVPVAELKAESEEVFVNDIVTITAIFNDENGIKNYSISLNGEVVPLDSNYQYSFIPTSIGTYTFELNVEDTAGHTSSANLSVEVKEGRSQPVVNYSIPRVLMVGDTGEFVFSVDSDTEISVKINGEDVALDADGKFNYTPDVVGDLIIDVHATNGGNVDTDFTLTVPVVKVELVSDKSTYSDTELVEIRFVCSENLIITDQKATIDNIEYVINNNTIQADGLDAGTHEVVWYAQDENGNVFTGVLNINVQDITPPEIEVTLSENALKNGDNVEVLISASDKYGIKSISATLNGNAVTVADNKIILNELAEGTYHLNVTAVDNNDNPGNYICEFTVLAGDTTPPELDVDITVSEDHRIEISAIATDDSGSAEITGTINDQELTFTDGVAYYNPDGLGDFKIVIRAEDAAGNFIEKTQTVTISEQIKEYELKLSVGLDKNKVKPNETVNISVKTNALLENITLNCTSDGGIITEIDGGYSFISAEEGVFEVVVKVVDESGNSVSETVCITVSNEVQDTDEEEEEYINNIVIEPQARVVLESSERTETKMTEEMAELADQLKTPLAVYEYLYNNLNTEYYIGSRKGAIGTYEQKGGNDVDCSSLLIAMLRYLGYEANYVTGDVVITSEQLMGLTATDTIENAEKVYMLLGRPLTRSNGKYIMRRTWVKAVVDGKEYQLDVNFKKFTPACGISDEIKAQNFDLDYKEYTSLGDAEVLFNEYKEQVSLTDINLSGRKLINRKITKLPLNLPYTCSKMIEEIHNIYESSEVTTDSITIVFGDEGCSITAPKAYISTISIQYVPSSDFYDLFEDLIDKPSSIYAPADDYIVSKQKTIAPALYLNNEMAHEWSTNVAIGDKQKMYILTNTAGQERRYTESRELIVGSIVSIVVDTQVISPQSLLTAYENYKNIKNTINENNFFESSYCDNYLNFIGNTYFAQLDIQNIIYSSAYNIYKERELSFGLFNYEPIVETTDVIGYTASTKLKKQGHFGLDIVGVYNQALSLSGNEDDVKSYLFATGYVSSYLESQTLQQFTGIKSVSTAEVFRQCNEKGIDLKMISSENKEIIETLQINAEDKTEITQRVNEGCLVIVPEKNISINQWTGTAYIVQSRDGTQNTFIITGDKNGGYSTMDIVAYMIIATIGAGVDMYEMIFGFVGIVSMCLALPVAPIIAYAAAATAMVVFAKLVIDWIEDYQETVDLYFKALDGDVSAANKLNGKAFLATASMFFDFATGGFSGSKGAGPDDIPTPGGRMADLADQGYGDDVIQNISNMKNVDSCSDELLESIAKSGKSAEVADTLSKCSDDVIEALNKSPNKDTAISLIAKHGDDAVSVSAKSSSDTLEAISNLSDEAAESFFKTAGKNSDELISAINKSSNIDEAVSFVSKYADDGAEIFLRHGDDAVTAVKNCQTTQEDALLSIFVYGDDAVEVIGKYGDDATNIIMDYSDNGLTALKNGITPKQINEIKEIGLTPDDFSGQGKIRNLKVESAADAQALIDSRNKIRSLFSDDELSNLKSAVLEQQDKLKSEYTGKAADFTPAVAGVGYKNADGSMTYYFGANDYNGNVPELPDNLKNRITNMDDETINAAFEKGNAIGSHAEIYAVAEMLKEHPDANIDDFVIYVNYSRPYNAPTSGQSFYTCAHCKAILEGFNILSNVEGF